MEESKEQIVEKLVEVFCQFFKQSYRKSFFKMKQKQGERERWMKAIPMRGMYKQGFRGGCIPAFNLFEKEKPHRGRINIHHQ